MIRKCFGNIYAFLDFKGYILLYITLIFTILHSLTSPLTVVLTGYLFTELGSFMNSEISAQEFLDKISKIAYGLVSISFIDFFLSAIFLFLWEYLGNYQIIIIKKILFKKLINESIPWYDSNDGSLGNINKYFVFIRDLQIGTSQSFGHAIHGFVTTIVCIILSLTYSWSLALIIFASTPLMILFSIIFSNKIQFHTKLEKNYLKESSKIISWTIQSIKTVMLSLTENHQFKQFSNFNNLSFIHYKSTNLFFSINISITKFLVLCTFVQGFWFGSHLVHNNSINIGTVMLVFFACSTSATSLDEFMSQQSHIQKAKIAAKSLYIFLKKTLEISNLKKNQFISLPMIGHFPNSFDSDIELLNVSFFYDSRSNKKVLNNLSLTFSHSTITFIMGLSGSGKSTIGELLANFYKPTSGYVMIDSIDLQQISHEWIFENILYVPQKNILLNTSLRENIAVGSEFPAGVSDSQILEACKMTCLIETLQALPDGLDTVIINGGENLSGGQKQRIVLARAIIRNSPILILDEALSALDKQQAKIIMNNIKKWRQNKTTIIITHDKSHISDNDFIYVISQGELSEAGYKKDLSNNQKSIFSNSTSSQATLGLNFNNNSQKESFNTIYEHSNRTTLSSTIYLDFLETKTTSDEYKYYKSYSKRFSYAPMSIISDFIDYEEDITKSTEYGIKLTEKVNLFKADNKKYTKCVEELSIDEKEEERKNFKKKISLFINFIKIMITKTNLPIYKFIIGGVLLILNSVVTVFFSFFLAKLLGTLQPNLQSLESIKWSIILLILAFLDAFLMFSSRFILESSGGFWVKEMSNKAFENILKQPYLFFYSDENSISELASSLINDKEDLSKVGFYLASILSSVFLVLFGILWALATDWKMTLVGVSLLPVLGVAFNIYMTVSFKWETRCRELSRNSLNVLSEIVADIRSVRVYALEKYFLIKHDEVISSLKNCVFKNCIYSGILYGILMCCLQLCKALILWYGMNLIGKLQSSYEQIMTAISLIIFSLTFALSNLSNISLISAGVDAFNNLFRLLELPDKSFNKEKGNINDKNLQLARNNNILQLKNICFSFSDENLDPDFDSAILKDVSIRFQPNSLTAIVGFSGSGKSTLASIIVRLFDNYYGEIKFGGINIKDMSISQLRSFICLMPQKSDLFPGTIIDNILFGIEPQEKKIDKKKAIKAAKLANIHTFIISLPDGYNTFLEKGDQSISGGQAQRIALARSLARDPKVLILDECTSALDSISTELIVGSIKQIKEQLTVIAITHTTEIINASNNILFMENGKVADYGSYEMLYYPGSKLFSLLNS